jgi:hypothetical protein
MSFKQAFSYPKYQFAYLKNNNEILFFNNYLSVNNNNILIINKLLFPLSVLTLKHKKL